MAMARQYNRPVVLYLRTSSGVDTIKFNERGCGQVVRISYHNGNHYNSVMNFTRENEVFDYLERAAPVKDDFI